MTSYEGGAMSRMSDGGLAGQPPTAAEQGIIRAARDSRDRKCLCGESHEGAITPAAKARMLAYLAANPGRQFAYDEEDGIVAVIIPRGSDAPDVVAWADCLITLLDNIGAPPAAELSLLLW